MAFSELRAIRDASAATRRPRNSQIVISRVVRQSSDLSLLSFSLFLFFVHTVFAYALVIPPCPDRGDDKRIENERICFHCIKPSFARLLRGLLCFLKNAGAGL